MKFKTQTLILVLIPGILNILTASLMVFAFFQVYADAENNKRSRTILLSLAQLQELVEQVTKEDDYLLDSKSAGADKLRTLLEKFSRSSTGFLKLLDTRDYTTNRMKETFKKSADGLTETIWKSVNGNSEQSIIAKSQIQDYYRTELLRFLFAIEKSERASVAALSLNASERLKSLLIALLVAVCVNEAFVLFIGLFFVRKTIEKTRALSNNAKALADGQTAFESITPGDELSDVDASIHEAAALLSEARAQQQTAMQKLEASERSLRQILQSLSFGIVEVSELGRIIFCNATFCSMVGIDKKNIFGQNIYELVRDLTPSDLELNESKDYSLKSAHIPDLAVRLSFTRLEVGMGQTYLVSVLNVNDEKMLQKLKQEFTDMVVHDLRTPLAAIKGSMQLFQAGAYGPISAQANEQYLRIERSTARLVKLINDLLTIDKLEAGKISLKIEPCDAKVLVEGAFGAVADLARVSQVTLKSKVSSLELGADADRILQVLVNLIGNAIKYSPPNSEVIVEAQFVNELIVFRVIDSGPGIPEAQIEKIFDRYHQVDPDRAVERKGTGLGLSIARAIVEAHGGQIGCGNNFYGKGSVFYFTIPVDLD